MLMNSTEQQQIEVKYDIEGDWILLSSCNFRCHYCFWPKDYLRKPLPPIPPVEQIVEFFDETNLTWLLHLTGGEPLLIPEFVDLCQALTRKHYISVNTNLSLFYIDKFIEMVPPDRVSFLNCAIHIEEREKRGKVDDFIRKVNRLEQTGFKTMVSYVCYPSLLERLQQDFDQFMERGIVIIPKMLQGTHEGRDYPAGYTDLQRQIFQSVSLKAQAEWRKYHPVCQELLTINIFKDHDFVNNGIPDYRGKLCDAGFRFVRIRENGDIRRCGKEDVIGNIFTKEFHRRRGPSRCTEVECPYFCVKYVVDDKS